MGASDVERRAHPGACAPGAPGGRLQRHGVRPHVGRGHVGGTHRLVGPRDPWLRQGLGGGVRQPRLEQQHLARLLPRSHHERGAVLGGRPERTHGVAQPRRRVEVHERRVPHGLRVPVCHRDHAGLVQGEHRADVGRELLEERFLGRARVAEHRGEAEPSQQLEGRGADHGSSRSLDGVTPAPTAAREPARRWVRHWFGDYS